MIKEILTPADTHIEFDIPMEYVGKRVEITFSQVDDIVDEKKITMADFWGILSDETARELRIDVEKSRAEWERDI
jgi:hypothetical protein